MSNKIKVIPFKLEHLEKLEVRKDGQPSEMPKTVLTTAWTYMVEDKPIAIFGGFVFIPGVIHFWAMLSDDVKKYPVEFHKQTLDILKWYEETEKPRRLQWEVRCDYEEGQRWAESLGLQREGILRKWTPDGADHYLYARICPCPM
jgi:hypothetical protein